MKQQLIKGELYHVNSTRKGKFDIIVTYEDETWVTGIITKGVAEAILEGNVLLEGEEVHLRKSLTTFIKAKKNEN